VRRLALRSSQYTITDHQQGGGTGTLKFGGPNLLMELMAARD